MPARAAGEYGVVDEVVRPGLRLDVRFGISVSLPQSRCGNSSIGRSP